MFIHQYPGWTNFRFDETLVLKELCGLRFLQGKLLGELGFALPEASAEVHLGDLGALLGPELSKKSALEQVKTAARNFTAEVTAETLLEWHSKLVQNGGRFRMRDAERGEAGFYAVKAEKVEAELSKFLKWFKAPDVDAVLAAAVAHLWFETIRPFASGNGALGRLLADILISRSEGGFGRYFELWKEVHAEREAYCAKLLAAQSGNGDITAWLLWFFGAVKRALAAAQGKFSGEVSGARLTLKLSKLALTARQKRLVETLRALGELSNEAWAAETGISHDSALRDFTSLREAGLVEKTSGGRATKYRLTE